MGIKIGAAIMENRMKFLEKKNKLKMQLPYWFSNSILGDINISKENQNKNSKRQKDTCTQMFTVALFTKAKLRKLPNSSLTDEWIKNI